MQTLSTCITNSLHEIFSSLQNYLEKTSLFSKNIMETILILIGFAPSAMNIHFVKATSWHSKRGNTKSFLWKEKHHLVYIVTRKQYNTQLQSRRKILHHCQPKQGKNYNVTTHKLSQI